MVFVDVLKRYGYIQQKTRIFKEDIPVKPLRFADENVGAILSGVKSFWEEDVRGVVLKHARQYLERLLNVEFKVAVGCGRYERSDERSAYRNGSYRRGLLSIYGWLENIKVPRLRQGRFESKVLKKYKRRSQLLDRLILEGFLLGHSTRKTARMFIRSYGQSISAQAVSNVVKELNVEVEGFHRRSLGDDYRFIHLDGLWVNITSPVKVKKVLLVAYGVRHDGERELIDFMLASSESEACWWGFLANLKERGLRGHLLAVAVHDGCAGLIKALAGLYPRVKSQQCVFHKLSNIGQNLIDRNNRSRITRDAAAIYQAETDRELKARLKTFKLKWEYRETKAVRAFIRGFERTLIYREYADPERTQIKTNNPLERYLEELQRRIKPFRKFVNAKSVDRIIYGIIAYVLDKPKSENLYQFTQFP
jgi:putative transposase